MTDLRAMFARLSLFVDGSLLAELQVKPTWIEHIKGKQKEDGSLGLHFLQVESGNIKDFGLNSEGMYRDLRELYWWPGLKQEVTKFVAKCLACQQVKAKHQLPSSLLQPVKIPLWKWERVTMDFASGLPLTPIKKDSLGGLLVAAEFTYNNNYQSSIQMVPYETLYDRRCRTPSCWTELGEQRVLGPELVSDTDDKVRLIRDRLKAVSDRQKSYANLKCRDIEYFVGDFIFLKLELPPELNRIHDVFHVSMLRHYRSDPTHIVPVENIEVRPDLTFEEEPVQILEHDVKVLRRKSISLVKVIWSNHSSEEAMWLSEDAMQQQYPHMF
ncbi:uncharacterized protein LOC128040513 [Gossypium raimondii]|uniref:uncharacterized protein LOC128040513 n=1 Tax=Gossypium raimondii TaxID=29730 RepID=UPI00227BE5C1|nr:uncharacterized protein LOC128040513 [Gossypium raimondii]